MSLTIQMEIRKKCRLNSAEYNVDEPKRIRFRRVCEELARKLKISQLPLRRGNVETMNKERTLKSREIWK